MFAKLTKDPRFTLSLLGLAGLALLVRGRRTTALDRRWSARVGNGKPLALQFSHAASPKVGLVESLAIAALPRLAVRERAAVLAGPMVAGLLGHALKRLVPRRRPGWAGWSSNGRQSFPSTHTGHASSLAFIAARVARQHGAGRWADAAAAAMVVLIALTRLRAKAHWPTDVLAGALVGLTSARAVQAGVLG